MTDYLKIEFETHDLKNLEQTSSELNDVLLHSFADIGLTEFDKNDDLLVNLEQPEELAVVETAVIIGLIGLSKSLVELYKYLKEKELEEKKLDLEKAKLEVEKLSETKKQQLRDDFIKEDLPRIFQKANITNVVNIGSSVVIQG